MYLLLHSLSLSALSLDPATIAESPLPKIRAHYRQTCASFSEPVFDIRHVFIHRHVDIFEAS